MEYLHSLLKFAVNMDASDVHIKGDHHATIRVSGELHPVQVDPPDEEQMNAMVEHMLPKHLVSRLQREKEVTALPSSPQGIGYGSEPWLKRQA